MLFVVCLDQLKLFNSSSTDKQYNTQLIRWGQVSSQDVNKLLCSGLMKFNFQERVNRFFLATFQNGEGLSYTLDNKIIIIIIISSVTQCCVCDT